MTIFFRLLKIDIDAKGARLVEQVHVVNAGQHELDVFIVEPSEFGQIPGSPFAYSVSETIRELFAELPPFEGKGRTVKQGLATADDFRFVRLWWEASVQDLLDGKRGESAEEFIASTFTGCKWAPFAKGGHYSPYYADIYAIVKWERDGAEVKNFRDPNTGRTLSRPQNTDFFFRPGLTFPRRTKRFCPKVLPSGAIFGHGGQTAFADKDLEELLGILGSKISQFTVSLFLGTSPQDQGGTNPQFETGIIQKIPLPEVQGEHAHVLGVFAQKSVDAKRRLDGTDEISHIFSLPALLQASRDSLIGTANAYVLMVNTAEKELEHYQQEIDSNAFDLYCIIEQDRLQIEDSLRSYGQPIQNDVAEPETEEENVEIDMDPRALVSETISYALGCAFGRWDVRFAVDPTLLPKLQEPFDPLPRCSPGMLIGTDGLPAAPDNIVSEEWLRARPNVITLPPDGTVEHPTIADSEYPLKISWDGIIPDDENHSEDVVHRVREVLELLWKDRAEAIEQEACDILGVDSLREYFRQPKHFFDFHIKRYSKSRRKAPIYWLLQSAKKNYGLWLYYHRIDSDTLFKALTLYADPKLNLENIRLDDLRSKLQPEMLAHDRRALEKAIGKQESLISELTDFRNELERVARLRLTPDLNDGVIISIAPLHNLVPWKEADKMWDELTQGKYEWSTMSRQMRERGLVSAG